MPTSSSLSSTSTSSDSDDASGRNDNPVARADEEIDECGESHDEGIWIETEAEHKIRHPDGQDKCPRCRFIKNKAAYCKATAYRTSSGVYKSWLIESYGDEWALGCSICAQAKKIGEEECVGGRVGGQLAHVN